MIDRVFPPAERFGLPGIALLVLVLSFAGCGTRRADREAVVYVSVDQVYAEPVLREYEKKTGSDREC